MKKNHTTQPRRTAGQKIITAVALVMAILMIAGFLASALNIFAVTKAQVDALKTKVAEAGKRKNELKNQLSGLTNDLSALQKQISLLDSQIEAQQDEIDAQEELLGELTQMIADKTIELEESERQQAEQYAQLRSRLRYMVEHGTTSSLSILLSSDSFSDFLNRYEIIRQISLRDESLFEQLKAIRDKVLTEKQELEDTKKEAEDTKLQMEANKAELEAQMEAKRKQMDSIQLAQKNVKDAYAAMIETEDELMAQYKKAAAEYAAQSTYVGGTFMWPLPAGNNVVTCKYGMRTHPITGKRKLHTGVDLRAATGTKVYAANKGTVTTSGYSSAWGNYIIISHGGGITTLYAHMSKRSVSKDDKVKQGDIIGYSGNTGYSTAPHLHFEISKNGSTYNPLNEFKDFKVTYK
ncbi:MAG: peptidoglycan DD-metalloendopeptidase family protein [Clostridia bacterium]|nr:peptidoglycan DD-metalloendopeptidase family protein [Clostridia bacterium]